jgi:hypothetical protein
VASALLVGTVVWPPRTVGLPEAAAAAALGEDVVAVVVAEPPIAAGESTSQGTATAQINATIGRNGGTRLTRALGGMTFITFP